MIDFQQLFRQWLAPKLAEIAPRKPEEIDELADALYEQWLSSPSEALDGLSPRAYYQQWNDAQLYQEVLNYLDAEMPFPDPLCDELTARASVFGPLMVRLLTKPMCGHQLQMVLDRLVEMQYAPMLENCLLLACQSDEQAADAAERAADAMTNFGQAAGRLALQALAEQQDPAVVDRLADIVASTLPGAQAYPAILALFEQRRDARAFYARALAKLGEEAAIEPLTAALRAEDLTYYDYLALRDAVEELGGFVEIERIFDGDADYQRLQDWGDEQ